MLVELAERCEAATASEQRELLELAFVAVHGKKPARIPGGSREWLDWLDLHNPFLKMLDAEAYESAALTLVPEGWRLRQMNFSAPCVDDRKWHLNLHGGREGEDTFVGEGATPALALCAALRAALNPEGSDHAG